MGKKKEKDFKKVKLKVGGKKDDGNNTNVSFKTKSIVVPNQSVADADRANKDPAAFDLRSSVSMLGHYASANRKDALSRLKDLATDNPRSMVLHLSQLISAVAPLLLDREFDVRRVLLQFAKALVKNVPLNLLRPFVPVVVTYSCSAMNHIVNDIRFDAVRFLNIWIEVFPSFFASGSSQIIQNFMSLLHLKKQKVSGKDQYIKKSKDAMMDSDQLTVLSSLNQLLRLSSTESFLAASSESPLQSLYFRKDITLTRHSGRWAHQSKFKLDVFSTTIGTASKKIQSGRIELSLGDTVVTAKPVANAWGPKDFVVAIVPACVDVWLDSAPQVLSGVMINEGAAIEKLNLAMGILHQALTANFGLASDAERKDMVNSFAKHVLVSFPYGNNAVGIKTENCERILQEMNIKTCEIVSLFKKDLHTQEWEEGMFDYLFKTIAVKDDSLPLGSLKMLFPLCASTIKDSPRGRDLLGIMVRRHKETPPRSASWIELFKFIRRVFMTINPSINDAIKADWITYLPRALWSLAHSNAAISREILTFLSEVLRSLPALDSPIASNIHNGLVPFFHVVTASKGPIFGPFLLLPVECQKTAIELLYYLPQWSSKLLSALAHCFTSPTITVPITSRALEIAFARQHSPTTYLPWDTFLSFAFTVGVVGSTTAVSETMQSAKNTLLNYDSVIDAATDTMTGELGVLCESARVRTIELIQARVYLSRMVAHAIMAEMPRALVTHFVMEALDGLLASVKTLDAYFGVCALVSAVLSEGAAMNVDMASEFVNALPGLCSASVLMCLADSIDNYEVFRVCADTSVDVIRCFPTLKGEFQKLMMANIANLPHSQRDRARMVLDKV